MARAGKVKQRPLSIVLAGKSRSLIVQGLEPRTPIVQISKWIVQVSKSQMQEMHLCLTLRYLLYSDTVKQVVRDVEDVKDYRDLAKPICK